MQLQTRKRCFWHGWHSCCSCSRLVVWSSHSLKATCVMQYRWFWCPYTGNGTEKQKNLNIKLVSMNENKNIGSDYRQIKDVINQNLDVVFFGVLFMLIDTKKNTQCMCGTTFTKCITFQFIHYGWLITWLLGYCMSILLPLQEIVFHSWFSHIKNGGYKAQFEIIQNWLQCLWNDNYSISAETDGTFKHFRKIRPKDRDSFYSFE